MFVTAFSILLSVLRLDRKTFLQNANANERDAQTQGERKMDPALKLSQLQQHQQSSFSGKIIHYIFN